MSSVSEVLSFSNTTGNRHDTLGGVSRLNELGSVFAKELFPRTIQEVLQWSEFLWNHQGVYAEALKQAVRYFLTDVEVTGDDEAFSYKKALKDRFKILGELAAIGDDFISTGNSFTSLYVPFDRDLVCPECGMRRAFREVYPSRFKWQNYEFKGPCPGTKADGKKCRFGGPYKVDDRIQASETMRPVIMRWPPQFMSISSHFMSRRTEFKFDISKWPEFVKAVEKGDPLFLEDTPWEFIKAIKKKKKLRFRDNAVFHMKQRPPAVSLPNIGGWGLPRFLSEFENVVIIAMLDRYNEAILKEYLIPFRVISPPPPSSQVTGHSMDVMANVGAGDFAANIKAMLAEHSRNPTGWHIAPTALNYQVFGGEADKLITPELLQHFEGRLLRGIGIPQEFQVGAREAPGQPKVRMAFFERSWQEFPAVMNSWLDWLIEKQSELLSWKDAEARLVPISASTDEIQTDRMLNLMTGRVVSQTTALRRIGMDREYEQKKIQEEMEQDQKRMDETAREQEESGINREATRVPGPGEQILMQEMAQQEQAAGGAGAAPGGMPPGGMPPGGAFGGMAAPGAPQDPASMLPPNPTLEQMEATAAQVAQQLYTLPSSQRKSQLVTLSQTNPTLHDMVNGLMQDMDTQAERQGREMARQTQPGQMQ